MSHAINTCEVYYDTWRVSGEVKAKEAIELLVSLGMTVREDMDTAFWQSVGKLKAEIKRVSLADCCALALAQRTGATLVTADHHEFDPIVEMNLCPITFIR